MPRRGTQGWREYTATFGDIAAFRPQVWVLAQRCGVAAAKTVVFLADGAACNRTLAAERKRELWEGKVAAVLEALEQLPARTPEQAEAQRAEAIFFRNNGERMA